MTSLTHARRRQIAFFLKLGAYCGAWYVLYDLWLMPDGRLDGAVARSVATVTNVLLNGIGFEAVVEGRAVLAKDVPGIFIADGCNGLATVGLFVGFVAAYPGTAWRRAFFLPLGAATAYLANVGRVTSMVLFQEHWPAGFDIMHTYGMTSLFYVVVFALWILWANYGHAGTPVDVPGPPRAGRAARASAVIKS